MIKCLFLLLTLVSMELKAVDAPCKVLKPCAEWANNKTGLIYNLGTLERRTLKMEKDFNINEGNPDLIFSYILGNNDLIRVKRENGTYDILPIRNLKNFEFPKIKEIELVPSLDFYTMEFSFSSKERVNNAMTIVKKFISKNGRLLESTDGTKITVTESGLQLILIKSIVNELNK